MFYTLKNNVGSTLNTFFLVNTTSNEVMFNQHLNWVSRNQKKFTGKKVYYEKKLRCS